MFVPRKSARDVPPLNDPSTPLVMVMGKPLCHVVIPATSHPLAITPSGPLTAPGIRQSAEKWKTLGKFALSMPQLNAML